MLLEGMNMPINRREFGRIFLGALSMYALGAPKNAKAVEEGEPSYYFNQFNTDIFAPIRTSDITPSNIQSRWRRIGSRPERTLNAFIDNNHLCFTGNGTVDVVHSNGTNRQYNLKVQRLSEKSWISLLKLDLLWQVNMATI